MPNCPFTRPAADLDQHLKDATDLRDRMAHTSDAKGLKINLDNTTFYTGSSPIRLMWVEGYIRAVEGDCRIVCVSDVTIAEC